MKKEQLPTLKSDTEAEAFVAEADLTEFDLSTLVPVRFELKRKDKSSFAVCPVSPRRAIKSVDARIPLNKDAIAPL